MQGSLTNFPVLISITDDDLKNNVSQTNGDDILFTDGANSMKLDHEIESYSSGTLVAWVRVPSLTSGSDYTMRMWYGNPSCGPQENPEGVWDSNYVMAQHLEEIADMNHYDSTANNNDGTVGADPQVNQNAAGKIDGADDFNGRGQSYLPCNNYKTRTRHVTVGATY